jgi:hypothetical protein
MSLGVALSLAAVAASILLLKASAPYAIAVIVVAALQVGIGVGIVSLRVAGVPLSLVLGGTLAVAGAAMYRRSSGKPEIAAAAVIGLVGLLQVLSWVRLIDG